MHLDKCLGNGKCILQKCVCLQAQQFETFIAQVRMFAESGKLERLKNTQTHTQMEGKQNRLAEE
jgi:hypothetical protein